MSISLELLSDSLAEFIKDELSYKNLMQRTRILQEIQDALQNDNLSDFDVVEEIVCIFEKYHIKAGNRHDFG